MEKKEVQHQVHLDSTADLLVGDLQVESTKAGLDNILQRWIEDVKNADNPELHQIVVDLQELKAHLGSGTYDKDVLGRLLGRLGENTIKASIFAEGNTRPRVENLGEALLKAGKAIQSPAAASPGEDLKNSSAA